MPPFVQRPLYRLRQDFQLSIITVFGICAVVAILPFAVLRAVQGQWLAAIVDGAIVLGIVGAAAYAWRGGSRQVAGLSITATNTAGCLLIVGLLGPTGIYWLFPALLANFFLVAPRFATIAALLAIALAQLQPQAFPTFGDRISITATLLLVCLFAYIFARRTEMQRVALEDLATRDPLTGVRNRRAMAVDPEFGRLAAPRGRGAPRLRVRVVVRVGGEEFVLLIAHADARAREGAFARLQAALRDGLVLGDDTVTMSGGAALPVAGDEVEGWLGRADAALYKAKLAGRDRLVIAPPP
ncbi:MAG: GGDEF domain-containing protein [Lysobacteraceae bacterium]